MLNVDINDRVKKIDDRVILINELSLPDPSYIDRIFDQINEISADWKDFYIIPCFPKDITISADVRARIKERFIRLQPRIAHVAAVVSSGVLVKLNFMFLAKMTGYKKYSIHNDLEAALKEVRTQIALEKTAI